jgi:hypothetical protein
MRLDREYVIHEYLHTWDRHKGSVVIAAGILGMTPIALQRALYRARSDGEQVRFHDDVKAWRKREGSAA